MLQVGTASIEEQASLQSVLPLSPLCASQAGNIRSRKLNWWGAKPSAIASRAPHAARCCHCSWWSLICLLYSKEIDEINVRGRCRPFCLCLRLPQNFIHEDTLTAIVGQLHFSLIRLKLWCGACRKWQSSYPLDLAIICRPRALNERMYIKAPMVDPYGRVHKWVY